jgi:hypothetical protein
MPRPHRAFHERSKLRAASAMAPRRGSPYNRGKHFGVQGLGARGRRERFQRARGRGDEGTSESLASIAEKTDGFSFAFLQELVFSATIRVVAGTEPGTSMADRLAFELDALSAQRRATAGE